MDGLGYLWYPVTGGYVIFWVALIRWVYGYSSGWDVLITMALELAALIIWSYELTGDVKPELE